MKTNFLLLALVLMLSAVAETPTTAQAETWANTSENATHFLENKGQIKQTDEADADYVSYMLQRGNTNLFLLREGGIAYQFNRVVYPDGYEALKSAEYKGKPENMTRLQEMEKDIRLETYRMDMHLVGANPHAQIVTEGKSGDYLNYYSHGALDVHHYKKITYKSIYPGIDWVIYTNAEGGMKYDFIVQPGADPALIKIKFSHQEQLYIDEQGNLIQGNRMGSFTEKAPVSFQNGKSIATSFKLENNILRFELAAYNPAQPLTIDPARLWATYYGFTAADYAIACATDAGGNVYMAGYTTNTSRIASGGYDNTHNGGTDAYLVKFNSSGGRLWATYYGGTSTDQAFACATDANGNIYLAGSTTSTSGIASGGHDNSANGGNDAFLVKFNSSGARQWATYYGGSSSDNGRACATDASGNIYLAGYTASTASIASGGHDNSFAGEFDAFLVKFNTSGVRQWATYYGGALFDDATSCATDNSGNVFMAGSTVSTSAIASGGHDNTFGGVYDAFLVKFNSSGARQWATYYGGTLDENGYSCAADGSGNVYLAGSTESTTAIASGGHDDTYSASNDAFLVKFNSAGVRQWATYYGGSGLDIGRVCVTDALGNVYLAGYTSSSSVIALNGFDNTYSGGLDAFLVKFNSSGSRQWATYFGGRYNEYAYGCALDANYNIHLTGTTQSTTEIAYGGFQNTHGYRDRTDDAFLAKFFHGVTTGTISGSPLCAGASVSVPYTKYGTFTGNNLFRAQLSDANGSFANPVTIGTLGSLNSGTINATIPANTPPGTGYRIRVTGSNPAVTGSDNGVNITITAPPTWYLDADNDNYYSGTGITQCSSPGAGYKSTGLLGIDCNDGNASLTTVCPNQFVTRWDLSHSGSGATQISFGVGTSGTVNYTWQEVSPGTATGSGTFSGSFATITGLPAGAVIRLVISPTNFNRFNMDYGSDRFRLVDVENWGSIAWSSMQTAFMGCFRLQISATDVPNLSGVSNMSSMFNNCNQLNGPANINSWNTSQVTNMSGMFFYAYAFNQNISNWNTAQVTNMINMFNHAGLFNQDISGWNTSLVTDMGAMFYNADAFNQNISSWNTSSVNSMNFMFNSANAFNQDLGSWQLKSSVDMQNMLDLCGMNCASYGATLAGWAINNPTVTGRTLGATGRQYGPEAVAARSQLTTTQGWTISGDATTSGTVWYTDIDGDGYYGDSQNSCASPGLDWTNVLPIGGSEDCDDADSSIWQNGTIYIDDDNDGYDNGSIIICYGDSIPAGYKAITLGNDCDDADSTVWQSGNFYIDNDGDGYGHGDGFTSAYLSVCYGVSPPSGYVTSIIGNDCNDADALITGPVVYYQDMDGDGFGNNAVTQSNCGGAPPGYAAVGGDCDDNNASIKPGATDICGNGIDEDCSGADLPCSGYTWKGGDPGNEKEWGKPANWLNNLVPNSCAANVTVPVTLHQPQITSGTFSVGNIAFANGTSLTLFNSNSALQVCGNVTTGSGAGTGIGGLGKLLFASGTAGHQIAGNLSVDLLQLDDDFGAGFVAGGSLNVNGILELKKGTFTTTGGTLRFTSTSVSACGIIDNFSPTFTGTILGTIAAERFYAAATDSKLHNQHFFGSPIDAVPVTQFAPAKGANGVAVTPTPDCDETKTASNGNYGNVFEWEEDLVGSCYLEGWKVRSSGATENARGYSVVKLGSGTLTLTGTPNLDPYYEVSGLTNSSSGQTFSKQGNPFNFGWSLVSNPYLAPIDLDDASNTDFDDNVLVLRTHGMFPGTFQPISMSGSGLLAPFQGFLARKSTVGGTSTFKINATDRRVANATFHKSTDHQMNLMVVGNGYADITYLNFNPNSTEQYDSKFDALKAASSTGQPTLFTYILGNWSSINSNPDVITTPSVRMGFKPGANGTFMFQGEGFADVPNTTVYLEDLRDNVMQNLTTIPDYTFTSDINDATDRFVLHFNKEETISSTAHRSTLTAQLKLFPNPTAGTVTLMLSENHGYTQMSIVDAQGKIVQAENIRQSELIKTIDMSGYAAGIYSVRLSGGNNTNITKLIKQ